MFSVKHSISIFASAGCEKKYGSIEKVRSIKKVVVYIFKSNWALGSGSYNKPFDLPRLLAATFFHAIWAGD